MAGGIWRKSWTAYGLRLTDLRGVSERENLVKRLPGAVDRQVRHINVLHAGRPEGSQGARAHLFRSGARSELRGQRLSRNRQELLKRLQRLRIGAAVIEDSEHAWHH